MTTTAIATTITELITAAGLNPADYRVARLAKAAAERIADSETSYDAAGQVEAYGILEADIWEGLAADNWVVGTYPGDAASDAAYAIADSLPDYGRLFWAAECEAAARRNDAAYAA